MAHKCENCGEVLFLQDNFLTLPNGWAHKDCDKGYYRYLVKKNAPKNHPEYIRLFGKEEKKIKLPKKVELPPFIEKIDSTTEDEPID